MEVQTNSEESIFQNEAKFYDDAKEYWSGIQPTVDGMLGGFGCVSNIDIKASELFLKKIFSLKNGPDNKRALDCGAGIGRVTKNLLVRNFDKVDLVEQNPKFVESAKNFLGCERNVGEFYISGLQDFTPKNNFYDVIWCQWVLGHLTDKHLVDFLIRCKNGIKKNGVIIVKENVSSGEIIVDEEDSSVTRSTNAFLKLFKLANLLVLKSLGDVKIILKSVNTQNTDIQENKRTLGQLFYLLQTIKFGAIKLMLNQSWKPVSLFYSVMTEIPHLTSSDEENSKN